MMVLISYDVATSGAAGKTRFEADLDYSAFLKLKERLLALIDPNEDSLRFYYLGNNWKKRIEHIGAKQTYDPEGVLIV